MADMESFREAITARAADGTGDPGEHVRAPAALLPVTAAVLLEGPSDAAAVTALAVSRGRDLAAEGICVLPMGGATSVGRFARLLGPKGLDIRLLGLCDAAERPFYATALTTGDDDTAKRRIFVCTADLEEELIRALGVDRVEELVRAEGDLRALRTLRHQPAQRGRTAQQQLRRFLGTKKGRKIRYGRVLVEALAPDRVPAPLDDLFRSL